MKFLVKLFFCLLLIITTSAGLQAQIPKPADGVFLNEQDFKINKLSIPLAATEKLQLNEFFESESICIKCLGQTTRLSKSKIYGYRLNNENFRFFKNEAYKIIDTAGFLLYSRERLTQQRKGFKPVLKYFFSTGYNQPILDLTIANLEDSFGNQTAFRYSLKNHFAKDGDLMDYDKWAGQYKIKYLYFNQRQTRAAHAAL